MAPDRAFLLQHRSHGTPAPAALQKFLAGQGLESSAPKTTLSRCYVVLIGNQLLLWTFEQRLWYPPESNPGAIRTIPLPPMAVLGAAEHPQQAARHHS